MSGKEHDKIYNQFTSRSEDKFSKKRKQHQSSSRLPTSHQPKRFKSQAVKAIAVQSTGHAFQNGEIDVQKYVKSREFEIRALEDSLVRSKKSASGRAFQAVPRSLRRRTASHNVKRVPKRLRSRAAKEMIIDNTPTVTSKTRKHSSRMRLRLNTVQRLRKLNAQRRTQKTKEAYQRSKNEEKATSIDNAPSKVKLRKPSIKSAHLSKPSCPPARYRKRQIHKTWLPTHLYHTKRAHMTPPKEPLWRFALPLTPTEKCYRSTHRSISARGGMAWDMSYISTVCMTGQEDRLEAILSAIGVGRNIKDTDIWHEKGLKWRNGTRIWDGWLFNGRGSQTQEIGPAQVLWCGKDNITTFEPLNTRKPQGKRRLVRKVFVRLHPSTFIQVWRLLVALCTNSKPRVVLEDLRFEIGAIEVMGPSASEAIVASLRPAGGNHSHASPDIIEGIWDTLNSVTNIAMLPHNVLVPFQVVDPRLRFPPKTALAGRDPNKSGLIELLASWPLDQKPVQSPLFDYAARHAAVRALPSQKAINRRRHNAMPGEYPQPRLSDPQIPIIAYTSNFSGADDRKSWTVLLPWKCVLPVWYALMYHPLVNRGNLRFGGVRERRQIAFEENVPWFPGDFPGTEAGRAWELQERQRRKAEWQRKPRGRRVEWDSVKLGKDKNGEIGLGWACYFEGFNNSFDLAKEHLEQEKNETSRCDQQILYHVRRDHAHKIVSQAMNYKKEDFENALITVNVSMLMKGVPKECARLYRLPEDQSQREKWLSLLDTIREKKNKSSTRMSVPTTDSPLHRQTAYLAASLLDQDSILHAGGVHPEVPSKDDLIGFVTTGNFNLSEGKGTAIASVMLRKLLERHWDSTGKKRPFKWNLCIIRESGQTVGRLAYMSLV